MMTLRVTLHAVEQYRDRVLGCPERKRSNAMLTAVISEQVKGKSSWKIHCWTYCFVVEDQKIITVLGYRMRPKKRRINNRKIR